MVEESLNRVHLGVRDVRIIQQRQDVARRQAFKRLADDRMEVGAVLDSPCVGRESRIGGQLVTPEYHLTKSLPLTLVLDRQIDGLPVAALERAVGGDGSVARPGPRRRLPAVAGVVRW